MNPLFDSFINQIAGSAGLDPQQGAGMVGPVLEALNSPSVGGLGGIVQSFEKAGLGSLVQSWINSGPNFQATPGQIQQGLGPDLLATIARKLNLNPMMASMILSVLLPIVIDKLTPRGQLPPPQQQGGDLGSLISGLGGLLGGLGR